MRMKVEVPEDQGWVRPLLWAGTFAYLAAAATLLWNGGHGLWEPIGTYRPDLTWTIEGARDARMAALFDSGRAAIGFFYAKLELFSALLVAFSVVVAVIGAMLPNKGHETDPLALTTLTVASVLGYAAFSNGSVFLARLRGADALSLDLGAMPITWFGAMMLATLLIAWTAGLLLHDLVLFARNSRSRHRHLARY